MCVKIENKYGFKVCYTTKTQKSQYFFAVISNNLFFCSRSTLEILIN